MINNNKRMLERNLLTELDFVVHKKKRVRREDGKAKGNRRNQR